jgi:hypothetical protein
MKKLSASEYSKLAFIEMMKDVATSTPGHILAFDPVTQLAQVQIGIVRKDINGDTFTPAPIVEVPVYFAGGGGFVMEHQIDPNDEGIVMFSQRCIDGWIQTGGVAQNPIDRFHDFTDAMFLPGLRSQQNVVTGFANDGIRIRNADGTNYIWLKSDGTAEIKVTSLSVVGDIVHHGNTQQTGDTTISGSMQSVSVVTGSMTSISGGALISDVTLTTTGDFIAGGISLTTHTHPYTWTDPGGSGDTGAPT